MEREDGLHGLHGLQRRVRRLERWNWFWVGLFIVGLVAVIQVGLSRYTRESLYTPRVEWQGDDIRIGMSSDGPIVVTHVQSGRDVAALSPPLGIVDSDGAIIGAAALRKLSWREPHGQPVAPPRPGAPLTILYVRPLTAETKPPTSAP